MEVRNVVMSIVSITVGILLVGSLLAPQAASVMEQLTNLNQGGWASLVGVTVVLVIISLILIALLGFSSKKQRGEKEMNMNKMIGMIIGVTVSIIVFVSVLVPTITDATKEGGSLSGNTTWITLVTVCGTLTVIAILMIVVRSLGRSE